MKKKSLRSLRSKILCVFMLGCAIAMTTGFICKIIGAVLDDVFIAMIGEYITVSVVLVLIMFSILVCIFIRD